ncbi:hypothetical protein DRO61_07830 [Candidatus Bathyarchaeota archaeon]|nr:MAG: hypothetical protein DRO61_07830 [Candidatus Bathyarchaeota archaeon]
MKKFKRKNTSNGCDLIATPVKRKIMPQTKDMTKRDYFAGEALFSLVVRGDDCNLSVESYYVADNMLANTDDEDWNPEIDLKDYFASKFISGVIQAKLDKEYSPKDAFEVAEEMLKSREKCYGED